MSASLPFRLCCMGVTMAPALTEAATQAIKLPETTPASSDSVSTGRPTDDQASKENQTNISNENLTKCIKTSGNSDLPPVSHLNGNSLRTVDKQSAQSSTVPKLQGAIGTITVPGQIKNLAITKSALLQNLVSRKISATSLLCGKITESVTMNRLPSAQDKDGHAGKHRGHGAQNRTHTCAVIASSGRASAAKQQSAGSSQLYVQGPDGNVFVGGNKSTPQASTNTSNHFHAGGSVNRHVKGTGMSKPPDPTSLDSSSDRCELDGTVSEQFDEASKKQAQLERRLEFLMRRVRRSQARQVDQHTRQELSRYVGYNQQNLQTVSKSKSSVTCQNGGDLNKELLSDGAKHMSTAALVSLVHKMQKQGSASQLPVLIKPEVNTVLNISSDDRKESLEVASRLAKNLHAMQSALDSDATESSSGGETDGEDGPQDSSQPPPSTPLLRRAEWKWASDRAAIASRWTWLQAQVSDLEYRIRQQTELYRQARNSKGSVVLADPPVPQNVSRNQTSACSSDGRTLAPSSVATQGSSLFSAADEQSSQTAKSASRCSSTVTSSSLPLSCSSHPVAKTPSHPATQNRLATTSQTAGRADLGGGQVVDQPPSSCSSSVDLDPALDPSCRAARCLPLKYPLRKRKLLRMGEVEVKPPKAAKLSTVKCHCQQGMTPCVLCCGKEKNTTQAVDPHYMSFQERVALMDPSFHPVLSFREEVPLSVHFEGLLRSGEWQNKATVRRPRAEQGQRSQKAGRLPGLTEGRKALLRKSQSSVIIQSAKIRNKYEHKAGRKLGPAQGLSLGNRTLSTELKSLNHAPFSVGRGRGRRRRGQGSRGGYLRRGLNASAVSQDGAFPKEKEVRRRRGESAYDINSIVIPRSMAALTRVEKLEYKEIPTPSWRELLKNEAESAESALKARVPPPNSNGLIAKATDQSEEESTEDLSDETYIQRHSVCELAEKKRFTSAVRLPHGRRRARAVIKRPPPETTFHDSSQPSTPSAPVSMGTQFSLDAEDIGVKESEGHFVEPLGPSSLLQSRVGGTPVPPEGTFEKDGVESSSRGSLFVPQEHDGASVDSSDPGNASSAVSVWPPRQFPLSEEEVTQLLKEDMIVHSEETRPNVHAVSRIQNLRPHPVETGSQAGSSVSSSLPASPLPSTSSASVAEDWDTGDTEWTLDADTVKKKSGQTKTTKR